MCSKPPNQALLHVRQARSSTRAQGSLENSTTKRRRCTAITPKSALAQRKQTQASRRVNRIYRDQIRKRSIRLPFTDVATNPTGTIRIKGGLTLKRKTACVPAAESRDQVCWFIRSVRGVCLRFGVRFWVSVFKEPRSGIDGLSEEIFASLRTTVLGTFACLLDCVFDWDLAAS